MSFRIDRLFGQRRLQNGCAPTAAGIRLDSSLGLKMELVHHIIYNTRDQARTDIFFYIEAFYNRRRRHSTLGYVSPEAYEAAFYEYQSSFTSYP